MLHSTAWKMSKYGVCSGPYFPVFVPEKTPYLGTFHAALFLILSIFLWIILPPANKLIWCHTSKKNQQQWFLTEISFSKIEIKFGLFYVLFQEYGLKNFNNTYQIPCSDWSTWKNNFFEVSLKITNFRGKSWVFTQF